MKTETTEQSNEAPPAKDQTKVRKLRLHKSTLLDLSDRELDDVRGGGRDTVTCSIRRFGCP